MEEEVIPSEGLIVDQDNIDKLTEISYDILSEKDIKEIQESSLNISFNDYYNEDCLLFINPLLLEDKWEEIALHYLPHDTGIEIECSLQEHYTKEVFNNIPNLVENLSTNDEQRFRIPSGLDGFKCLFNICEALKQNCLYSQSGIHYHIDMRHVYNKLVTNSFICNTEKYVLNELESWDYKGTYNSKKVGGWYRFQAGFQTIEFRIGEMTFEYPQMVKRICHGHYIVKMLSLINSSINEFIFLKKLENIAISEKSIIFASEMIQNKRIFV